MSSYWDHPRARKLFSLTSVSPPCPLRGVLTATLALVAWQILALSNAGQLRVAAQVAVYPGAAYHAVAPVVALPNQMAFPAQVVAHQRPVQPHRLIHVVNVRRADGTRETRIFTGPQAARPAKQLVPTTGEVVSHSVQRAEVPSNAGLGWSVGKDAALAGVPVEQSYVSPDLVIQEDQPGTGATIAVQTVGGNLGRGALAMGGTAAARGIKEKEKSAVNVAPPPAESEEREEPEPEPEEEPEEPEEEEPQEDLDREERPAFRPPKLELEPVKQDIDLEPPSLPPLETPPIEFPPTGIREGLRRHKAAAAVGPHHIIQPVNVFHPHRSHIGFAQPLFGWASLGTFLVVSWGSLEGSALVNWRSSSRPSSRL